METIEEEGNIPPSKNKLKPPDAPIGGLLGNVSLLTTGGSSLQQQLSLTDKGMATFNPSQSGARQGNMGPSKKLVNTSTPARPFTGETVMYGFDLSPVHSYESKQQTAQLKDGFNDSETLVEARHSLEQEKLEDEMFADRKAKSAPNFMQAPLVASPHQSRSGVTPDKVRSNDTETMMRQVYSGNKIRSSRSNSSGGKKKKTTSVSPSRSPPQASPRKSSKKYAHIRGSGYGVVSPMKSRNKHSQAQVSQFGNVRKKPATGSFLSPSSGRNQYSNYVHQSRREEKKSGTLQSSSSALLKDSLASTTEVSAYHHDTIDNGTMTDVQQTTFKPDDTENQVKYEMLEIRYNAIRDECRELQEKNNEIKQENFLLSSKLNRVMEGKDKDEDKRDAGTDDSASVVERLRREIAEQEKLIQGYQQENERAYKELTKVKTANQENEAAMFKENVKLKSQLAALKEELAAKEDVIKDKNLLILETKAARVQKLNRSLQTDEDFAAHVKKVNFKCTEHLELIKELQEKQARCLALHGNFEEERERYRRSEEDVALLKSQVSRMKKELLLKNGARKESQLVQDLRRQVKELEKISTKQQTTDHVQSLLHGDGEVQLWKERAEKLEERLKEREESSSKGIQSLQNMYSKMRLEYEQRVDELARQLEIVKLHSTNNVERVEPDREAEKKIKQLEFEKHNLNLKVQSLEQNLANDRKTYESKMSFYKKKLKAADSRSYHPGHFANIPKSELKEITNSAEGLKQTYSLEKKLETDLTTEIRKWQEQCDELKTAQSKLKADHEKQLTEICRRHNDDAEIMRSEMEKMRGKLENKQTQLISTQAEKLSSQSREKALQLQIKNLLDELHETRNGSPNVLVRRLAGLQAQVRALDHRQRAREDKLNSAMTQSADSFLRDQVQHLRAVISEKNLLLSKFRCELDSILQVLEGLQQTASVT